MSAEEAVYDLLRRVTPSDIEQRLYDAIHLSPDLTDTLLSTVDTPMKVIDDTTANGKFIACEFNRDLDSHRSPLSNKYFPDLPDGQPISKRLRDIEIKANRAFDSYRHLYFEGGISSVYLWDIEDKIFGFGVFIKNEVDTTLRTGQKITGSIDCSDVVEVDESGPTASYTMTSSVLMHVELDIGLSKPLIISGSTASRKSINKPWKNDDDHIVNIGEFVESTAKGFREAIDNIYISKIKQITELIAKSETSSNEDALANELRMKLAARLKS